MTMIPTTFEMLTTEELPLTFDATAWLEVGQTISDVVVTLEGIGGTPVDLATEPIITGNLVTQVVDGSQLTVGSYRLVVTFNAAPETRWSMPLVIRCPY